MPWIQIDTTQDASIGYISATLSKPAVSLPDGFIAMEVSDQFFEPERWVVDLSTMTLIPKPEPVELTAAEIAELMGKAE